MGSQKKECPPVDQMYAKLSSMLVPDYILQDFAIYDAHQNVSCWVIEMYEKEGRIPSSLQDYSDVVLDGYCNPVEMLSHSFVCKPVYLRLYRRRYKRSGTDEHFSNDYDFTLKGVKMVPELGVFLKEEDRRLSC
jgi:hypothetical protein